MTAGERFSRLPTAAKLLLILTAVLLPIGIALAWLGETGIRQANAALQGRTDDEARAAASAIDSLIARNALALRVAAAGALRGSGNNPCEEVARSLATAPAISREFSLRSVNGDLICTYGAFRPKETAPLVAPGDIRVWLDPSANELDLRVGVIGGTATATIAGEELKTAALDQLGDRRSVALRDGAAELRLTDQNSAGSDGTRFKFWPAANGAITVLIASPRLHIATVDRLVLLLPVLMWVAAALITWSLVSRLLVRPLKRLERAVRNYEPGQMGIELPDALGPSAEIQQLRGAFARAITRVEQSEQEMTSALEGQRRLVREVHHRVKNNLQVVASLLNIHSRSAETPEAKAAYASISRRVGALSLVQRSHYAEMEENRGIAVRPLIAELAAELRAGAPEAARGLTIDLDLETVHTTQDVAVAIVFLITEVVECSMLRAAQDAVEIDLQRTSPLTACLSLGSRVLNPDEQDQPDKVQFERIIGGLAKQLRSPLERKLGRYSVDIPVFPPA